jgi:hypothetical protein
MNAQVRIGGNDDPDDSALLDVNKNNDAAPAGAFKIQKRAILLR